MKKEIGVDKAVDYSEEAIRTLRFLGYTEPYDGAPMWAPPPADNVKASPWFRFRHWLRKATGRSAVS